MIAKMKLFLVDDNGATAIEYGLIAAGISVAIIAVVPDDWYQAEHGIHQSLQRAELVLLRLGCAERRPPQLAASFISPQNRDPARLKEEPTHSSQ